MTYSSGKPKFLQQNMILTHIVNFRDASGKDNWYEAISIIEHQGVLSRDGMSAGHYICDIKDKSSKCWYRTNDDKFPFKITTDEVSTKAYAVLYRRIEDI